MSVPDANSFIISPRVQQIVIPWAKSKRGRPTALIMDNVSFHMGDEIVELCHDNGIRIIGLPRNSTYLTQPLDVAFFGPFKKIMRETLGK